MNSFAPPTDAQRSVLNGQVLVSLRTIPLRRPAGLRWSEKTPRLGGIAWRRSAAWPEDTDRQVRQPQPVGSLCSRQSATALLSSKCPATMRSSRAGATWWYQHPSGRTQWIGPLSQAPRQSTGFALTQLGPSSIKPAPTSFWPTFSCAAEFMSAALAGPERFALIKAMMATHTSCAYLSDRSRKGTRWTSGRVHSTAAKSGFRPAGLRDRSGRAWGSYKHELTGGGKNSVTLEMDVSRTQHDTGQPANGDDRDLSCGEVREVRSTSRRGGPVPLQLTMWPAIDHRPADPSRINHDAAQGVRHQGCGGNSSIRTSQASPAGQHAKTAGGKHPL